MKIKQKKDNKVKPFLVLVFSFCITGAYSQSLTKYFDSNWNEAPKEQAYYYSNFVQDGAVYQCTSYWADSNQLFSKSTYTDTSFTKEIGTERQYYRSGKLQDSVEYGDKGKVLFVDHYSETGKHEYHAFYDEQARYMKAEQFDDNGNKIPGVITFQKQAMFPGGLRGWITYLENNLKVDIPMRKNAPVGNYAVVVSFLVDKKGKISEVTAENNPGYGTAEEAVRVIKNGPDWIPAVQNNQPVIYRQKQNITFQVSAK